MQASTAQHLLITKWLFCTLQKLPSLRLAVALHAQRTALAQHAGAYSKSEATHLDELSAPEPRLAFGAREGSCLPVSHKGARTARPAPARFC